ncbi:hypothetical protein WHR41_02740 [Cladosporium halotolerans]|uniref:Uncharacterized protein n=1 Tax=Cladosporium halotolerans TaxID=1052096 RepID=A0AB34KUH7_9PEZI
MNTKSPTTQANIDTAEGVQESCILSLCDGESVDFTRPGNGRMIPADLKSTEATSLTVSSTDSGDVTGLFTKQASLFLDDFRYAFNPDLRTSTYSTTACATPTALQPSLSIPKASSAASD